MTAVAHASADVGVIGLAVMGQNHALDMADHGYRVAVYNRTTTVVDRFVAGHRETPGGVIAVRRPLPLLRLGRQRRGIEMSSARI